MDQVGLFFLSLPPKNNTENHDPFLINFNQF